MRYLIVTLLFPVFGFAQTVDVNKIDTQTTEDTTIQIHKGKTDTLNTPKWDVQDGTADVEGEASATQKDAKKAWTKACNEWKKEFKEDNKDNKVLSVNCGSASCSGEAGSKVCTSKATYKVKTRVD
jgi:hypothetical protein